MSNQPKHQTCGKCGAVNDPGAIVCRECGVVLSAYAAQTTSAEPPSPSTSRTLEPASAGSPARSDHLVPPAIEPDRELKALQAIEAEALKAKEADALKATEAEALKTRATDWRDIFVNKASTEVEKALELPGEQLPEKLVTSERPFEPAIKPETPPPAPDPVAPPVAPPSPPTRRPAPAADVEPMPASVAAMRRRAGEDVSNATQPRRQPSHSPRTIESLLGKATELDDSIYPKLARIGVIVTIMSCVLFIVLSSATSNNAVPGFLFFCLMPIGMITFGTAWARIRKDKKKDDRNRSRSSSFFE